MAKKIRIVSKKEGFRRCGIAHSETPKLYDADAFTKQQLELLKREPMLIVDEIDVPDGGKGKSDEGKSKSDEGKGK